MTIRLFIAIAVLTVAGHGQTTVFFDDFAGSALDAALWEAFDNSQQLTVSGGTVSMSSDDSNGRFPYAITTTDPFPSGDFTLRVRMRHPSAAQLGVGLVLDVGRPVNGGSPQEDPGTLEVAGIWQDTSSNASLFAFFAPLDTFVGAANDPLTSTIVGPAPDLAFHDYEFTYDACTRTMTVDVDGAFAGASAELVPRPRALWFGNPAVVVGEWTHLELDEVEIVDESTSTTTWAEVGDGLGGASGVPRLDGAGALEVGECYSLLLSGAKTNAPASLVAGFSTLSAPFKGGVLVPSVDVLISGFTTSAKGQVFVSTTWPIAVPPGFSVVQQFWIVDAAGPAGFAATPGVVATN